MKGIRININDIVTSNSFDLVKLVVKIIAVSKNLTLSETELYALTHFVIDGYSKISKENLINIKLLKNKGSVYNLVYAFKKCGVIVKSNLGEQLHQDFRIPVKDLDAVKIEMLIKK